VHRPAALPRSIGLVLLLLSGWRVLAAQTETADSLWGEGDYPAAQREYLLVLHQNPGNVRALYRLGILASWDGRLDSALALLRDARELEPMEPDVRLHEARVLSWQGRYQEALVRFDSLLVELPQRRDFRVARAQTLAWAGQNRPAERAYRALLAEDSADAEALIGLAQLLLWQGRASEAETYNTRALAVVPDNRTARDLAPQIRAIRRPRTEAALGFSHDSDHNTSWWQSLDGSVRVAPGIRVSGSVKAYQAGDPQQHGSRVSGEAGAGWDHGNLGVSAALGGRRLASDLGGNHGIATWRVSASLRISSNVGLGAGYAHYSFDETAFLISSLLKLDELLADGDLVLGRELSLGIGTGYASLSDGNRRSSLVFNLTRQLGPRFAAGGFARGMWYDRKATGYFSPDRLLLAELRGIGGYGWHQWSVRVTVAAGLQQAGTFGTTDPEWHLEARLARRWAAANELALSGGISNSALGSTSGAFHYYTGQVTARLGL
jgi:tetratricopeptide (TPR) repeat protein